MLIPFSKFLQILQIPVFRDIEKLVIDSYKGWSCAELCEAFTFLVENIYMYVQFDGMVYQQIVGVPMGINCAPLIADLFLYCYERDFMSDLQKSKRFDLSISWRYFHHR